MFLKWKTLDCGKHKITLESIQTFRSKICFPAEELELFLKTQFRIFSHSFPASTMIFFSYC